MEMSDVRSSFQLFRRLLSLSKPDMGRYALLVAASLLSTVMQLGLIEATRRMITGAAEQVPGAVYSGMLIGLAAILLLLANDAAVAWLKASFANRSTARLQLRLLKEVTSRPLPELAQYHSSELYGRINDSAAEAQKGLSEKVVLFLVQVVQLGAAFAYFSWLNMQLTLGMIVLALLYPLLTYPLTGRLRRQHDRGHREAAQGDEFLQDAIQGSLSVRALSLRSLFAGRYREKLDRVRKRDLMIAAYDGVFDYANRALLFGGMLFTLGFGGYQVLQGSLTIGGLTAFVAASSKLTGPVRAIAGLWNELIASISHTGRFVHFLDSRQEAAASRRAPHFRQGEGDRGVALQVSQLFYAYQDGANVLKDVNLAIRTGELVAIVGASGCGKSTLLKLLARLDEPASGTICCNQVPLQRLTIGEWHNQLAFVPQESVLFTGTLRDNIRFGRLDASQAEVESAARLAQIHDRIAQLPQAYGTRIGASEVKLSGGEIQRLALARAFVRRPALLLLDEPTASLDPVTEALVMEALIRSREGRTTVMITHKPALARQADRIVVMDNGRVAETGSHKQLMSRRGCYYTWICAKASEEEVRA